MATYKLNLKNPLTTTSTFNVNVKGYIEKISLAPHESIDLTTLDAGFTVNAPSETDLSVGKTVSINFMSGLGDLEILMRDHVRGYDNNVRVRNRPFFDYFFLT